MSTTTIDNAKLSPLVGTAAGSTGETISPPMVVDETPGLYRGMAGAGPLTAREVAKRTGPAELSVAGRL
jgi:hypothetical protein